MSQASLSLLFIGLIIANIDVFQLMDWVSTHAGRQRWLSVSKFMEFTSLLPLSVPWLCCIDIISHEKLSRPIFICSPILGQQQQHCNTRGNIRFGQQKSKKTDSDTQKTCQHSCMWPLSNVWRVETDAECWVLLAGPGPPQAETHWQKWLMMCAPALQAGPHQLMVRCLI